MRRLLKSGGAVLLAGLCVTLALAGAQPVRAPRGMVVAEEGVAARVGRDVLRDGGNAVDAAVATAFALAVTLPRAGNIGGGGFLLYRPATGEPAGYDFRETAPAAATPTMFLKDGKYDEGIHHKSPVSVGVPGTVAGLYLAWKENGKLPWKRLVQPSVTLAREGIVVDDFLARSLKEALPEMKKYPASISQFAKLSTAPVTSSPESRNIVPYEIGDVFKQPDLARTLARIAHEGPAGFYEGPTALSIESEMKRTGGLITRADLKNYRARRRTPVRGSYRGVEVIAVPPPTSGGVVLLESLNILEGYDLAAKGFGSADAVHLTCEALRRSFADRARWLGDPDFNPGIPIERLISKVYAAGLRRSIRSEVASVSSPKGFEWPAETGETTHLSIVDAGRNAVSMTYTLEEYFGSKIVVPGAGFLLNNEMGDFNSVPGLTDADGKIGTDPNLAAPGKRMLSSMSPTILAKEGRLFMVTGSPGGRSIISTVLETIEDVVDFGMNVQEAIDAPRFHHQWLPDRINIEKIGFSPDTLGVLKARGHAINVVATQGVAQAIVVNESEGLLEGGCDRRNPESAAVGF